MAPKSKKKCNCVCHLASSAGFTLCDECKELLKKNKSKKTTRRRQPKRKTSPRRPQRRRQRKSKGNKIQNPYSRNIYKLLKCIYPDLSISRMAMNIMNSFIMDLIDRIASEASTLMYLSQKSTMGHNDIMSAAKLVIKSPEMSKLAIDAAKKTISWSKNH